MLIASEQVKQIPDETSFLLPSLVLSFQLLIDLYVVLVGWGIIRLVSGQLYQILTRVATEGPLVDLGMQ